MKHFVTSKSCIRVDGVLNDSVRGARSPVLRLNQLIHRNQYYRKMFFFRLFSFFNVNISLVQGYIIIVYRNSERICISVLYDLKSSYRVRYIPCWPQINFTSPRGHKHEIFDG